MKKNITIFLASAVFALNLSANESITILDKKSPEFLLGQQTHINMKFVPSDAPDMWLKAGVRIQGTFESKTTTDNATNTSTTLQEAYLRRVRFEVAAGFGKHASFTMDVRNDKSNKGIDNDEGSFNVGDAYVKIKKPFNNSLVNFKLYRAKIDISRTETVKSARVIVYDRPYVADAAAQYISFNRRASNVQMYGNYKKKVHYQIAAGSASSPDKIIDATGAKATNAGASIEEQSFFYGGKIRLSPFDGWEEKKRTETYFGRGKHFSLGASYWAVPKLSGTVTNSNATTSTFDLNRELINLEVSAHYKGIFVQAEYFEFKNMVKAWDTGANATVESGTSTGWYVTGEYVMPEFNYIAPFARYESWDRFDDLNGYNVTSTLAGINWYLRGNTTKVGFVYQKDEYEINTGNEDVTSLRITSQWFF
ncbi:porin [Sulfurimonas sp.]